MENRSEVNRVENIKSIEQFDKELQKFIDEKK